MIHVPHVQSELVFPGERVAPVHLRPAGDARQRFVPARLLGGVTFEVCSQQRARTHQAHFAFEHVHQLGQLIEAGGAQEAPELGQALLVGQRLARVIHRVAHRAELEKPEQLAVQPRAFLAEEHRPAQLDAHQHRGHQHHRGEQDEQQQADEQVEKAFSGSRKIICYH